MYHIHQSEALNRLFKVKPYQGVAPEDAKYIFLGLDANYVPDIEESPIYDKVLEYLEDGVGFWKKYGVHHPFLLPGYKGDGQFYHKSFARIGLTTDYADHVSFVELIDVPTYGQSKLIVDDLNHSHVSRIRNAIIDGPTKCVFVPTSVGQLMRKSGVFPELRSQPIPFKEDIQKLKSWGMINNVQLVWHYHFSVYGKFEKSKSLQLREISRLLTA